MTSEGHDAEGMRCHVEQQHFATVLNQRSPLDRRSHGHNLVRVHSAVGRPLEESFDCSLDCWHASHSTDEDDILYFIYF